MIYSNEIQDELYEALKTGLAEIIYYRDGDEEYAAIAVGEIRKALKHAEGTDRDKLIEEGVMYEG